MPESPAKTIAPVRPFEEDSESLQSCYYPS